MSLQTLQSRIMNAYGAAMSGGVHTRPKESLAVLLGPSEKVEWEEIVKHAQFLHECLGPYLHRNEFNGLQLIFCDQPGIRIATIHVEAK